MSKKIFWGLFLVIFGLFYTLQKFLPETMVSYILNYQVFLLLLGIFYVIVKKRKTMGGTLILIALYLYLKEFFEEYFELYFPVIVLTSGIVILAWGIYERKLEKKENNNTFVFKSTSNVEEAEEIVEEK